MFCLHFPSNLWMIKFYLHMYSQKINGKCLRISVSEGRKTAWHFRRLPRPFLALEYQKDQTHNFCIWALVLTKTMCISNFSICVVKKVKKEKSVFFFPESMSFRHFPDLPKGHYLGKLKLVFASQKEKCYIFPLTNYHQLEKKRNMNTPQFSYKYFLTVYKFELNPCTLSLSSSLEESK